MAEKTQAENSHWATPKEFYYALNSKYHFDFDPCPLHHDLNDWDGLKVDWGKRNFVNPQWDRKTKEAFINKALQESRKGKLCVLLLPVSTSTAIFHDVILKNALKIKLLKGRLCFEGINTFGQFVTESTGRKDHMIVVFRGGMFWGVVTKIVVFIRWLGQI